MWTALLLRWLIHPREGAVRLAGFESSEGWVAGGEVSAVVCVGCCCCCCWDDRSFVNPERVSFVPCELDAMLGSTIVGACVGALPMAVEARCSWTSMDVGLNTIEDEEPDENVESVDDAGEVILSVLFRSSPGDRPLHKYVIHICSELDPRTPKANAPSEAGRQYPHSNGHAHMY
jgi:hypothetical protein